MKIVTIFCRKRNDHILGAKIDIFCSKIKPKPFFVIRKQKYLGAKIVIFCSNIKPKNLFFVIKKQNILARKLLLFSSKIRKIFWRENLLKAK